MMMWLSVIASLVCFAVATVLFTPALRYYPFYRPLALYFIFQGLWMILNWGVGELFADGTFMILVEYVGSIVFAGYLAYRLYNSSKKGE